MRTHLYSLFLAAALIANAPFALSQKSSSNPVKDYPTKPVRWIIDFGSGGLSDTIARIVGAKLNEAWHQPVINEARPGANGTIAYNVGAKATPDGYTLVFISTPFSINPSVYANLPYDTHRDFAPISMIALYPNMLVVTPKLPVKNVGELIAYAKNKAGGPTWATVGVGSPAHIWTMEFTQRTGTRFQLVPYRGGAPAIQDILAGRIDVTQRGEVVNLDTARGAIRLRLRP